jgi:hypothetical protein
MCRKKTATSTPPPEIAAFDKVKLRRQPLIGVSSSLSVPLISKSERSKALLSLDLAPRLLLMLMRYTSH